ncbi:unnamed protein product, partial [Timema podura]|nr:unnamed protein product [Timema podura]
ILYERCVTKIQEIADYDLISTVVALECFYELLKILLARYQANVTKYLADIGSCVARFTLLLPETSMGDWAVTSEFLQEAAITSLSIGSNVYVWCKTYAEKKHMLNEVAAKSFVSLLLQLHRRCKTRGQLIESMAKLLCRDIGQLDPDVALTKVVEYKIVTQKLRMPLFSLLCSAINANLNEIFWMVNWLPV